uniref:Uncharacterized protein n=1 Tax=Arundo donax TaxID=35708 RepID=A0A0A9G2K4_ARUDO
MSHLMLHKNTLECSLSCLTC